MSSFSRSKGKGHYPHRNHGSGHYKRPHSSKGIIGKIIEVLTGSRKHSHSSSSHSNRHSWSHHHRKSSWS